MSGDRELNLDMTRWDKFRSICCDKEAVANLISNLAYDNEPTVSDIIQFFDGEFNDVLDNEYKL